MEDSAFSEEKTGNAKHKEKQSAVKVDSVSAGKMGKEFVSDEEKENAFG